MLKVNQVTDDTLQHQDLILEDGTIVHLEMYFVPMQQGWFITRLSYGDFVLEGLRVCTSPNMLQQFKNQISFGLACYTNDGGEPKLQQDFSSGYAQLFVLTQAEVNLLTEYFNGEAQP